MNISIADSVTTNNLLYVNCGTTTLIGTAIRVTDEVSASTHSTFESLPMSVGNTAVSLDLTLASGDLLYTLNPGLPVNTPTQLLLTLGTGSVGVSTFLVERLSGSEGTCQFSATAGGVSVVLVLLSASLSTTELINI